MSLPLPNLDDRTFDDLVAEGLRLIPGFAPGWTDHNASDPGITLLELFAFVAETLIYRTDQVTDAHRVAFVRLLRGDPSWRPAGPMRDEIREAVLWLGDEQRGVTAGDFRRLATTAGPAADRAVKPVARAHCLPGCNVEIDDKRFESPSHVSVLILPAAAGGTPAPDAALIAHVTAHLAPRCLLTTRLHVAGPRYVRVRIRVRAWIFVDQDETVVRARIEQRLADYLHPLRGGPDGTGWPFGAAVYVSDVYALLDGIEGVDYLVPQNGQPEVSVIGQRDRELRHDATVVGVRLLPDELVDLAPFVPENPSAGQSWVAISRQGAALPVE